MPTPATPSAPQSSGDDRAFATATATGLEDRLQRFWEKNRGAITAVLVIIALGIIARGGYDYFKAQREHRIQQDYAAAVTPEQLKSFAATHAQHVLGGVAQLRLADEAYTAGKSTEAIAAYGQAATVIKTGPLASRARLGEAMAKLQAGQTANAEAALKTLANNTSEALSVRSEALYQLANLAAATGKSADVTAYADQLMQIDPASPFAERVIALRASQPVTTTPSSASDAPAISLPAIK
jgi:hypothetical protein